MSSDIAILVPVYNEQEVLKEFFLNLKEIRPNDTIIVIDDGSSDNSASLLREIGGIYLLTHDINMGQGASLQTGIKFARKLGFKYAVTIDSDGQHDPKEIELFERTIKNSGCDIVLGSRFLGNVQDISSFKKIILKLATIFTWIVSGIKLTDCHNGLRIIDISNDKFNITQNRMAHASEIIDIIKNQNLKYEEIPCTVIYNDYTIKKGQRVSNSINIVLETLFKRFSV